MSPRSWRPVTRGGRRDASVTQNRFPRAASRPMPTILECPMEPTPGAAPGTLHATPPGVRAVTILPSSRTSTATTGPRGRARCPPTAGVRAGLEQGTGGTSGPTCLRRPGARRRRRPPGPGAGQARPAQAACRRGSAAHASLRRSHRRVHAVRWSCHRWRTRPPGGRRAEPIHRRVRGTVRPPRSAHGLRRNLTARSELSMLPSFRPPTGDRDREERCACEGEARDHLEDGPQRSRAPSSSACWRSPLPDAEAEAGRAGWRRPRTPRRPRAAPPARRPPRPPRRTGRSPCSSSPSACAIRAWTSPTPPPTRTATCASSPRGAAPAATAPPFRRPCRSASGTLRARARS